MEPVVRAIAVSKRFAPPSSRSTVLDWLARLRSGAGSQARTALRDLSFDLLAGEWLGVIGHNGAAKTTLLRLVAGIHRPTSGTLDVRGRVIGGLTTAIFLGQFASPVLVQPLVAVRGIGGAFAACGVGMIVVAVALTMMRDRLAARPN